MPCGLDGGDVSRLDDLMFTRRKIAAGQMLYREGDRFQFMNAVRSGTFKTSLTLADGREQVSGFHMAGELMGLDGVAHGVHASSATALDDTEVCAIPYAHLSDPSRGPSPTILSRASSSGHVARSVASARMARSKPFMS